MKTIDWIGRAESFKPGVRNVIAGRSRDAQRGKLLQKYSPRDGDLLYRFGAGVADEVDEAIVSARGAFQDGRWSQLPVQRRKDCLYRLADLIDKHREELALLECLDVGKPITVAYQFDVPAAAATIRHSAEAADKLNSQIYGVGQTNLSYQLRRPVGVVAGIVGWNFPLLLAAGKVGPALATGNSLVLKPSEVASLSAARLAEFALEAGIPEGVFNVVHGDGEMGAALVRHADVDLVSFTGSSATGKKLLVASGQSNMKRLILECGGKAPNIVFDDSPDLESVADAVLLRAFWNQGEVCTASSRLLVQEGIKDDFLSLLVKKVAALTPGDPLKSDTEFGALVSREHRQKVLGYVDAGEREGARIISQSKAPAPHEQGFYVPPVIFDQVLPEQKIAQEEIFGPVLSAIGFSDEGEAIRITNGTIYGLSAILWTRDMGRAHRVTMGINAGWITVNSTGKPIGGADSISVGGHKQSGVGVEGGVEGLQAYTTTTAVQYFV